MQSRFQLTGSAFVGASRETESGKPASRGAGWAITFGVLWCVLGSIWLVHTWSQTRAAQSQALMGAAAGVLQLSHACFDEEGVALVRIGQTVHEARSSELPTLVQAFFANHPCASRVKVLASGREFVSTRWGGGELLEMLQRQHTHPSGAVAVNVEYDARALFALAQQVAHAEIAGTWSPSAPLLLRMTPQLRQVAAARMPSHGPSATEPEAVRAHLRSQFLPLLGRMRAHPEAAGSALDIERMGGLPPMLLAYRMDPGSGRIAFAALPLESVIQSWAIASAVPMAAWAGAGIFGFAWWRRGRDSLSARGGASLSGRLAAETETGPAVARREVVAKVGHELRAPLGAVIGFAEIMKGDVQAPLDGRQAKRLDQLLNAALHMQAILDDASEWSKLQAGLLCPAPGAVEAAVLEQQLREQLPELHWTGTAGLPVLWTDAAYLKRALKVLAYTLARDRKEPVAVVAHLESREGHLGIWMGLSQAAVEEARVAEDLASLDSGHTAGIALCLEIARLTEGRLEARELGSAKRVLRWQVRGA